MVVLKYIEINFKTKDFEYDCIDFFYNHLRGVAALETYGQEASAMNRAWGWDYAYTKEMMPFVPNFAYYNEANPTGWYFPASESQGIRMTLPSYENLPSSLLRTYIQMQYEAVTDLFSRSSYISFYMPYYASYPYYIPWSLLQIER
jgi:hypothetical protein